MTPNTTVVANISEWETESAMAHKICPGGYITLAGLAPPPTLQSRGQNQKWLTNGLGGYIILAALEGPQCFKAGHRIRSGPQVGQAAA